MNAASGGTESRQSDKDENADFRLRCGPERPQSDKDENVRGSSRCTDERMPEQDATAVIAASSGAKSRQSEQDENAVLAVNAARRCAAQEKSDKDAPANVDENAIDDDFSVEDMWAQVDDWHNELHEYEAAQIPMQAPPEPEPQWVDARVPNLGGAGVDARVPNFSGVAWAGACGGAPERAGARGARERRTLRVRTPLVGGRWRLCGTRYLGRGSHADPGARRGDKVSRSGWAHAVHWRVVRAASPKGCWCAARAIERLASRRRPRRARASRRQSAGGVRPRAAARHQGTCCPVCPPPRGADWLVTTSTIECSH